MTFFSIISERKIIFGIKLVIRSKHIPEITGEIVTHQPGTEENKSSENHGVDMAAPETCASEETNTELKGY